MQDHVTATNPSAPDHRRGHRRHGSALVLTMVVVMGLVALVSIAADHMVSSHKLSMLNLDRQRARLSAETVAAMVESRLVDLASTPNPESSELDNLSRDFHELQDRWWGLRGACYSDGSTYHQAGQGLWLNGCVVRWRIEPVRVYARTLDVQGVASGMFTVNSETDPTKALDRADAVGDPNLSPADPGFFHFRIVAEAHTLEDPRNGDEKPWEIRTAARPQVAVQAQRVVQLQLINLFKYALFHAQEDERGDIDLQTGASLTILKGSVHSNASIYIRGGENNGFTANPRNYHQMASGDDGHNSDGMQFITLGSAAEPIDVVGVNGIFRMGKTANLLLGVDDPTKRQFANPLNVPVSEPSGNGDRLNLNGDGAASKRHHINGVPFTLVNDSRSPTRFQDDFQGRARDKNNGGEVVRTLANIPELAGRPLEFQQLATDEDQVFLDGTTVTRIRPDAGAVPLSYDGDPLTAPTRYAADATRPPLNPEGARLYWDNTYTVKDLNLDQERNPAIPGRDGDFPGAALTIDATSSLAVTHVFDPPVGDGFDDREVKGYYLERGLFGRGVSSKQYYGAVPTSLPKTGLVIRERPQQAIRLRSNGVRHLARPTLPAGYSAADFAEHRKRYAAYLKSQYVVLFAGRNITEVFFNQILSAVDNPLYAEADFIVTEDEFIDARETSWMAANYGVVPKDYFNAPLGPSYRQNVLTLNLRRIQDFLKLTPGDAIDPVLGPALARTRFNGLIYVHRTRRSETYHPLLSAYHAWLPPDGTNRNVGRYTLPQVPDPATGTMITPNRYDLLSNIREGHGPLETTRCAVRIRGGLRVDGDVDDDDATEDGRKRHASIDWEASGGPDPLGNSGLTIITPDRCYLWGDFNTTTRPDEQGKQQVVPCAVFADGITALSANWQDRLWQDYATSGSSPLRTYGNTDEKFAIATKYITSVVLNNVPNASWNVSSFGTGGTADTIRLLEVWSGKRFTFRGSMVVLNEQRYSRCGHFYTASRLSNFVRVFETGDVEFTFNTDLLTRNGQPPFSPWGFRVTRVVSTVNVFNN